VRLVHLADLHLGFRQFQRQTPAGINQREADVAASVTRAVDRTISLAPDIVIIAGDVFHQVRPANPAILHAFSQMARLVRALPGAIIVMIAGNHDTPRSRDTVCILRLFSQLGIHVVDGEPRHLKFDDRGLAILCVPDVPDVAVELLPDPSAKYNVLALHGEPRGFFPSQDGMERAALLVAPEDLARPEWDYVALGHYHVHRQVAPRAWYSGALEYTSTNPWLEIAEERDAGLRGKGIVEFDLAAGRHTFHVLPVSRQFVDLPAIEGRGLGASELDVRIAETVAKCRGGIEDKVVRLRLRDVPRHVARDLSHTALRDYRRRALHFHLDVRPPEVVRRSESGAPGRAATLLETLRDRLRDRPLDGDLDRDRFIQLGIEYLARVEAGRDPAAPVAEAL
jgi:DNA repair exonuclease SbcCD nuclease subunit